MQPHVKNYLKSIGATHGDCILCEVCGVVASDIHHIQEKGMGGRAGADEPYNLIALCRGCHDIAHMNDGRLTKETLKAKAALRIQRQESPRLEF